MSGEFTVKKGLAVFPSPAGILWPGLIYPFTVPGRFGQSKSRNLVKKIYSVPSVNTMVAIPEPH